MGDQTTKKWKRSQGTSEEGHTDQAPAPCIFPVYLLITGAFSYRARGMIKIRRCMEVRCLLLSGIVLADSNLSVLLKREHSRRRAVIE